MSGIVLDFVQSARFSVEDNIVNPGFAITQSIKDEAAGTVFGFMIGAALRVPLNNRSFMAADIRYINQGSSNKGGGYNIDIYHNTFSFGLSFQTRIF